MTGAMTLTGIQREVAALRDLPEADRVARALALIPAVDEVLASGRVGAETAARVWASLARAAGRRVPAGAGRQAVLDALSADPVNWLAEVRAAATAAATADRQLRQVVTAARANGMPVDSLAAAAGVSRQTISAWTSPQK